MKDMIELILVIAIAAIVIRGIIADRWRNVLLDRFRKRIIEPLDYVIELQEQGFFRMLYETGGCSNDSYVDSTFVRSRQFFLGIMELYDDSNVWKEFVGCPKLGRLKDIYDRCEPACRELYNSVYNSVSAATEVMMQKHMSTWDEYAQYLMDNKTDKED